MLKQQQNTSGDDKAALQGFGRITADPPPTFNPISATEDANSFFTTNGYVVLSDCLNQAEIDHLNEFYDRTHRKSTRTRGDSEKLVNRTTSNKV